MLKKALYKTVSWGLVAMLVSIATSFIVFGDIQRSFMLIGVDALIFPVVYYAHEYLWLRAGSGSK